MRISAISLGAFLAAWSAAPADAAVVYQNVLNATGTGFVFNGAATVGSDLAANIDLNELTLSAGSGGDAITSLAFQAANDNTVAVVARAVIDVWAANGASGGPGTLLGTFALGLQSFAAGFFTTATTVTVSVPAGALTAPSNGVIWAGIGFDDDDGASAITGAQLDDLGGLTYHPATIGSDNPQAYFLAPGGAASDPAASPFGTPYGANYGWTVQATAAAVPEPGTLAALLAPLAALWLSGRRERG